MLRRREVYGRRRAYFLSQSTSRPAQLALLYEKGMKAAALMRTSPLADCTSVLSSTADTFLFAVKSVAVAVAAANCFGVRLAELVCSQAKTCPSPGPEQSRVVAGEARTALLVP